jgi:peptidoglycan-N-acetylglucosamine deacetylase
MQTVVVAMLVAAVAGSTGASAVAPDPVKWNQGSGPANMRKGLPDPPGWYRAAVGPRTDAKVLYLTFDDGPSRYTPGLLKALHRHKAKVTFFVAGGPADSHRAAIRRMHHDGHAIGNHTWWHPRLTQVSTARVRKELRTTRRAVGPAMAACMRPPYGLIDRRVAKAAIAAGFQPVMWTAHIEDWAPHSLPWTVRRLRQDTSPGAVILMHDTHRQTVAAVKTMLPRWREQGYRLLPVPACGSRTDPVQVTATYTAKSSTKDVAKNTWSRSWKSKK